MTTDQTQDEGRLIWIDCEMTGLDPQTEQIIEIAMIITDDDLNEIAVMNPIVIHASDEVLSNMDEWCVQHHGQSGLTERVRNSQISLFQAQAHCLAFVSPHVKAGVSPMCGNSIHQDRRFLEKQMPAVDGYCSYRNIDVSTVKELAKRWHPDVASAFKKRKRHLALDDIRESIAELKHYQQQLFGADIS